MNYICSKCGAALDFGERCECGGRAMRANKAPLWAFNPPSGGIKRYEYRIKKIDTGKLVRTYTNEHEAVMGCGSDEYVETIAVVG